MKKLDMNGINFDLPERYEPIKLIGKGTYGAVVSAIDNINKEKVAIKKLSKIEDLVSHLVWLNIFNSVQQIDAKRVLREIKIMKNLQHENILGLKDVVYVAKEG